MSDTDTLPVVPLVADNLIVVVTENATTPASPGVPEAVRDGVRRIVANGLTLFVALCIGLVVFLFAGTALRHSRDQRALRNEFRSNDLNAKLPPQAKTEGGALAVVPIPAGGAVAILHIPRVGVNEVVSEGTTSTITLSGPGHLDASPLPGQYGNAVIMGRHSTGGAPFADIGSLRPGDHFSFVVGTGVANYEVMSVGTHRASDMSVFATQRAGGRRLNTATLVTSTSMFDTDQRLVVVGELQGTAADFTPGRIAPNADELGLSADTGALLPLVLALQFLLFASIAAVWLVKRWNRYAAWVMATPVLLCSSWLVFEQFTRLLPATL